MQIKTVHSLKLFLSFLALASTHNHMLLVLFHWQVINQAENTWISDQYITEQIHKTCQDTACNPTLYTLTLTLKKRKRERDPARQEASCKIQSLVKIP